MITVGQVCGSWSLDIVYTCVRGKPAKVAVNPLPRLDPVQSGARACERLTARPSGYKEVHSPISICRYLRIRQGWQGTPRVRAIVNGYTVRCSHVDCFSLSKAGVAIAPFAGQRVRSWRRTRVLREQCQCGRPSICARTWQEHLAGHVQLRSPLNQNQQLYQPCSGNISACLSEIRRGWQQQSYPGKLTACPYSVQNELRAP